MMYSGVIEGTACLDRKKWLEFDPRNFVGINLEAKMHTEEVNETSDASVLCRTKEGGVIDGV